MARKTVSPSPPLRPILHKLYDALYILRCGVNSLELRSDDTVDEQSCLKHGLQMIEGACENLDRAVMAAGGDE